MSSRLILVIATLVVFAFCAPLFVQNCGTGTLQQPIVSCCSAGLVQASLCVGNLPGNCQDLAGPYLPCTEACGILQAANCNGSIQKLQDTNISLHSLGKNLGNRISACSDPNIFEQWLSLKAINRNRTIIVRGM